MIFPKGMDPLSLKETKGVATFGSHQWPNGIVPYDLSAITCKHQYRIDLDFFFWMSISFIASRHQDMIVEAMQILMYAVATPVSGETNRKACVYFRPRTRGDRNYFRVIYGDGCSGTVRNDFSNRSYAKLTILSLFRLDTRPIRLEKWH